jgi:hypothetical protein
MCIAESRSIVRWTRSNLADFSLVSQRATIRSDDLSAASIGLMIEREFAITDVARYGSE